jgi:hypothetical protein
MFFGARKRTMPADDACTVGEPCASETGEGQARQWLAWRGCAQRVTRAWNEWLAADSRQRPARYRCYLSALAEEEQAAAEVERIVAAR